MAAYTKQSVDLGTAPAGSDGDDNRTAHGIHQANVDAIFAVLTFDATNKVAFLNESANANMTVGLTINQGANDDQAICLKSSDVATGITSAGAISSETDDYAVLAKNSATGGGLIIQAAAETGSKRGVTIFSMAGAPDTSPSATADASIILAGNVHDGANARSDYAANSLVFGVYAYKSSASKAIMFIDAEGDLHVDGSTSLTAFDDYDDIALISGLRGSLMPPKEAAKFGLSRFIDQARPVLEEHGIVSYNDDGHHFISYKGLAFLTLDAIRQFSEKTNARLDALEARI